MLSSIRYECRVNISIELFGQLSPNSPRRQNLDLPPLATVQVAAALLELNLEEIGMITIDGVQSEMLDALTPNCRLCFFPYLSGG
jgi:hypothetical protein